MPLASASSRGSLKTSRTSASSCRRSPKPLVIRIQRALQSPDTKTEDVVRILSSEPALAARLLRMANSAEFRRVDQNITDLRKAVARMGFNMVRSVAVAFAMRQLRRKDTYSPTAQLQLEQA